MSAWRAWLALAVAVMVAGPARPAEAQDRFAVVIFGAPGGAEYEKTWASWRGTLAGALHDRLAFPFRNVTVLSADALDPSLCSTAGNVRRVFERVRAQAGRDDLVLVVLVGHGTVDGESAKFNLVGPDLDVTDWAALVERLPGRVAFINAAGASFPFLESLSSRNRIVVTATDSNAQRYDTVFPGELVKALGDPATDLDKNGRLSLWEVFAQASAAVRQYYEQRGQLSTERALLDDNGDRQGQEAGAPGQDGALARTTYIDADPVAAAGDPELTALVERQRSLEAQAELLKLKKRTMPAAQWEAEFERLMIELARVSRTIRSRS